MKKCPECGNPSYDGAPACGNCGYKFPKMKPSAPKKEIFDKAPEKKKKQFSDEESTIEIIKENKILQITGITKNTYKVTFEETEGVIYKTIKNKLHKVEIWLNFLKQDFLSAIQAVGMK